MSTTISSSNQVYKTMELYSKQIMSGGEGARYAGNTVIYITKAQEKDGDELVGFFSANLLTAAGLLSILFSFNSKT